MARKQKITRGPFVPRCEWSWLFTHKTTWVCIGGLRRYWELPKKVQRLWMTASRRPTKESVAFHVYEVEGVTGYTSKPVQVNSREDIYDHTEAFPGGLAETLKRAGMLSGVIHVTVEYEEA